MIASSILPICLTVFSGSVVGFTLGLMGGGGSILATPLLLYAVGIRDVHTAIGTGAVAVSINAYANLYGHWRKGHVWWKCASAFTLGGVVGAIIGSTLGKALDGHKLLSLFGLLMIAVAILMRKPLRVRASSHSDISLGTYFRTAILAVGVGFVSGFFGIGGGFLIVPGLMLATGMPLVNAIGSSLLSVGTFGTATALNYSWSGQVAWMTAAQFIVGGILGGFIGLEVASRLSAKQCTLNRIFSAVILVVAFYVIYRSFEPTLSQSVTAASLKNVDFEQNSF